jgi:hypothetical protein
MRAVLFAVVAWLCCSSSGLFGQDCPSHNPAGPSVESVTRTLAGRLIYHDNYRQWFGLMLDVPVCGVREIQLVDLDRTGESPEAQHLEVYRGCQVRTTGVLDVPGTTYFSAEVFQVVETVMPYAGCRRSTRFPNYQSMRLAKGVRSYSVTMRVNYKANTPVRVFVREGTRRLFPTQVYAPYSITGGFSISAQCAQGFGMNGVRGTREGRPSDTDGTAWIDPESAAAKGIWDIRLSYGCSR